MAEVAKPADVGINVEEKKASDDESGKFTFLQAVGLNTMNMFGTGPLITIPYCLAAVEPQGPHAMIGYAIAAVGCMMDSLVWGELGSMFPYSGGSVVYLKECYGPKWGRLAAWMFVWQFIISGPCEVASGFIAIAEYLTYFSPDTVSDPFRISLSVVLCILSVFVLYRKVSDTGKVVQVLWGITIVGMIYTIGMGFGSWSADNMVSRDMPATAGAFVWAIASATRFGVYDMTGYYDVNSMGDEVQNPKRTIPLSCIATCVVVGIIYLIIYVAVIGCWPWADYIHMYQDDFEGVPKGIMSVITEYRFGSVPFAGVVTILVVITIFGSTFAQLCGYAYLLCASGRDGYFLESLGHMSEKHEGLADNALLLVGFISCVWCFFSLDTVIDAMTTLLVMVQFVGQSVGLMWYRYQHPHDAPAGWRMPLYPLPCIIQVIIFTMIFITSDSVLLWGSETPILELSVVFLVIGCLLFLVRAKYLNAWPFGDAEQAKTEQKPVMNVVEEQKPVVEEKPVVEVAAETKPAAPVEQPADNKIEQEPVVQAAAAVPDNKIEQEPVQAAAAVPEQLDF